MTKAGFISLGALAMLAAVHSPLRAQSNQSVQLAFGYECGDRFMVRNDGMDAVTVEYAVAGSGDRAVLHLNARQSKEIASAQVGNVELWVGGKMVASEPKGNRACNGSRSDGVVVRPLDQSASSSVAIQADTAYVAPQVVYAQPYDYYYPYAYGYYPYGYYGYAPYYYPSISIRGGFGRGFGGGFRGGRGRR
jgi:hypothetical protein